MCAIKISPSVLACDFSRLGQEIQAMEQAGADMIHLDVMDGHFVPNISFGPGVIGSVRRHSTLVFDTHLMVSKPLDYVPAFAKAGSDLITFHIESDSDVPATLGAIKEHGCRAGLVLKPQTPVQAVQPYLSQLDMVLIMSVEPGFGGQAFMEHVLPKAAQLRRWSNEMGRALDIEIDGGIDPTTAPLAAAAGVNVFVAGSSLYSKADYGAAVAQLRQAASGSYVANPSL